MSHNHFRMESAANDTLDPTCRVVELGWHPRTRDEWAVFTSARLENGRLWNALVESHGTIRKLCIPWPSQGWWQQWAKGRFPHLSAQTVQQGVQEFCEAVTGATMARRVQKAEGVPVTTRYPWRTKRYRGPVYSNQTARIAEGVLHLPHGKNGVGTLRIPLPPTLTLPGRLMEARLEYGRILLVCESPGVAIPPDAPVIGVDLGVNTLLAATDGQTAVLVSGREAKAVVQYRNKANAELVSRIDRAKKGSTRRKRLTRAKYRMLDRSRRKLKDVLHKATRVVANAFPGHRVVVGKPFNDAAQKIGRKQAQQVSSASNRVLIALLAYKMFGATEVSEAYSSQTCPGCGCLQKCKRVYRCGGCGWSAPRDVVGAVNIRSIGLSERIQPAQPVPQVIRFVRPLRKYPVLLPQGENAGSSGGTPARPSDGARSSVAA